MAHSLSMIQCRDRTEKCKHGHSDGHDNDGVATIATIRWLLRILIFVFTCVAVDIFFVECLCRKWSCSFHGKVPGVAYKSVDARFVFLVERARLVCRKTPL